MKLHVNQISEIRNFINKKGIMYLDVQMEIIDHTASCIEERMTADKSLSFEQALKQTHASFGIFGFGGVEDSIVNGMDKRYRKIFWSNFLSFFGVKYIVLVLIVTFLCYQALLLIGDQTQVLIIFILVTVAILGILAVVGLNYKGYKKLLVYRTSVAYLMFIGSFLQLFNLLISRSSAVIIFGINRNFAFSSILFVFFAIYVISAIKTAAKGIAESKELLEKYKMQGSF